MNGLSLSLYYQTQDFFNSHSSQVTSERAKMHLAAQQGNLDEVRKIFKSWEERGIVSPEEPVRDQECTQEHFGQLCQQQNLGRLTIILAQKPEVLELFGTDFLSYSVDSKNLAIFKLFLRVSRETGKLDYMYLEQFLFDLQMDDFHKEHVREMVEIGNKLLNELVKGEIRRMPPNASDSELIELLRIIIDTDSVEPDILDEFLVKFPTSIKLEESYFRGEQLITELFFDKAMQEQRFQKAKILFNHGAKFSDLQIAPLSLQEVLDAFKSNGQEIGLKALFLFLQAHPSEDLESQKEFLDLLEYLIEIRTPSAIFLLLLESKLNPLMLFPRSHKNLLHVLCQYDGHKTLENHPVNILLKKVAQECSVGSRQRSQYGGIAFRHWLNECDNEGMSPLNYAMLHLFCSVIEDNEQTIMIQIINQIEIIRLLVELGADPDLEIKKVPLILDDDAMYDLIHRVDGDRHFILDESNTISMTYEGFKQIINRIARDDISLPDLQFLEPALKRRRVDTRA